MSKFLAVMEVAAVLIEFLMVAIKKLLFAVLGWVSLPHFPGDFLSGINTLFGTILDYAVNLIALVIPWRIVTVGIPIVLVVIAAKYMYYVVMWIVKKIPVLGMQ